MKETRGRLDWIDIAKGILIILIVIGHINYENSIYKSLQIFINYFHVAAFFVISGYTLKDSKMDSPIRFIVNKVKRLYVPLVIFFIIAVCTHNYLLKLGIYSSEISYSGKIMYEYTKMDLIKKLLACILMLAKEPIVGPLWFLCVLFESLVGYCILTFLIVKFNLNKNIRLVLILIVTVLSVYMTYRGGTIPRVSNVPAAMLCICIGQMCSENKVSYTNIYIFVICTVLLLSGVLFEQSISFNSNKFENPMYFVGSVLCGMYFVFYISKKIAEIKVLSLLSKVLIALGQSSLYIMALHLSCFKIVDYIIDIDSLAQLTPMADNLIEVIVFALFGLGVPYVVWKMRNVIWSRLKKQ